MLLLFMVVACKRKHPALSGGENGAERRQARGFYRPDCGRVCQGKPSIHFDSGEQLKVWWDFGSIAIFGGMMETCSLEQGVSSCRNRKKRCPLGIG
jgi:hypothetical protein